MKKLKAAIFLLVVVYLLLLIPEQVSEKIDLPNKSQFVWDRDSLWNKIENNFRVLKQSKCDSIDKNVKINLSHLSSIIDTIASNNFAPSNSIFDRLLNTVFASATLIGACPDSVKLFETKISELRHIIKKKSIGWKSNSNDAKNTLYKLIYGSRAAVEEVILQFGDHGLSPLTDIINETSHTPFTKFLGVNIHSGDILVSRGGAPTSALISRGSDYPGNFSHIALVYVEEETNIPYIIESHIEIGVTISSLEDYINDKKLRVMVLRPRADLPQIIADPMLPHKAAYNAIVRAKNEHIPYDFSMDVNDETKLFCSEVASSVYKNQGLELWLYTSTISNIGTAKLLSAFGVKYFETQEPSDLEYDPNLTVVAEWRDYETLLQDHIDNVVVDAILEWADKGNEITHDWYLLPIARVIKLYSVLLNQFEFAGPIPEGMSATSALKHESFNSLHGKIKEFVIKETELFIESNGYTPPYWRLVEFANEYFNINP